jgi:iron complex transport system permease protein
VNPTVQLGPAPQRRASPRFATVMLAGGFTVLVLALLGLRTGPAAIPLGQALALITGAVATTFGGEATAADPIAVAVVWELRLPRVLVVAVIGACLAVAGTVTQGLFRNPLAEPGVLGISAGAALAAVVGFVLRADELGLWATPLAAAIGAVAVLAVLGAIARPSTSSTTLLLSGVAIGALCGALTTLALATVSERWDLGLKVVRWLMGSFEGRSWGHLTWALPPALLGLALALATARSLDTLQLGSDTARSLGVDLTRLRWAAIAAIALLVGTATAIAGVIGFVGLVVPHVARSLLGGPDHARLTGASALLGAALLLAVDVGSRAVGDVLVPPGVITALLGAPFFLWLLRAHGPGGLP